MNPYPRAKQTYGDNFAHARKTLTMKPPKPLKERAWSHQDELKELMGKRVGLEIGDRIVTGTLINADAFTVQIRNASWTTRNDETGFSSTSRSLMTFFKHAIKGFHEVEQ